MEHNNEKIRYKKSKSNPVIKRNREVFEFVEMFAIALVTVILVFTFVFRIVGVKGTSMTYTLNNNDRLILSNISYQPKDGDIVVLGLGEIMNDPIIKRVIATEGETVEIKEDGELYLNGSKKDEEYTHDKTYPKDYLQYPFTVPEGSIFVMGDNRMNSMDGRNFGCVNKKTIIGKAVFRIFPFTSVGKI